MSQEWGDISLRIHSTPIVAGARVRQVATPLGTVFLLGQMWTDGVAAPGNDSLLAHRVAQSVQAHSTDGILAFHGNWSMVLVDRGEPCVTLAVDRKGTQPLYYATSPTRFVFGTDLIAVGRLAGVRDIDPAAVVEYSCFEYCLHDKTWLKDVRLMLPGTVLRWRDGRARRSAYHKFDPRRFPWTASETEKMDRMDCILSRSVKRCCSSTGRIGITLTGGLDSRLIVGYAADQGIVGADALFVGRAGCWDHTFGARVAALLGMEYRRLGPQSTAGSLLQRHGQVSNPEVSLRHTHFLAHANGLSDSYARIVGGICGGEIFGQKTKIDVTSMRSARQSMWPALSDLYRRSHVYEMRESFFARTFTHSVDDILHAGISECMQDHTQGSTSSEREFFVFTQLLRRFIMTGSPSILGALAEYDTPFLEDDLISLAYSLPLRDRENESFYRRFLERRFPALARVSWQSTGYPPCVVGKCRAAPPKRRLPWQFEDWLALHKDEALALLRSAGDSLETMINMQTIGEELSRQNVSRKMVGPISVALTLGLFASRLKDGHA
jgi:asparagine synthase (glutamine-hydrolysing)